MSVHVVDGAPLGGSAQIGRKPRRRRLARVQRSVPPAACTTAAAVREHALWLAADVVAMTRYERELILGVALRTTDPEALAMLNQLACVVLDRREHARRTASFLDGCVAKLEEAEELRDWDGLADLRCFTGKEIAALINPLLDDIDRLLPLGMAGPVQVKLASFFETFEAGIFEGRITYAVNQARRATLDVEFARWRERRGDTPDLLGALS